MFTFSIFISVSLLSIIVVETLLYFPHPPHTPLWYEKWSQATPIPYSKFLTLSGRVRWPDILGRSDAAQLYTFGFGSSFKAQALFLHCLLLVFLDSNTWATIIGFYHSTLP